MPLTAKRPARFDGARYLKFRCTECGNCCSDTLVPITGDDLRRLMKGTGLPASEIADFYLSTDFEDGGDGLQFINMDGGRKALGLRKAFDKENDREACKFFKDNRCSVYEHRPVTCRVWPFTLSFDESGRRLTRLRINDALPCPYELDGKNSRAHLAADWNWDDKQDGTWEAEVRAWNLKHSAGAPAEFLAFIGLR